MYREIGRFVALSSALVVAFVLATTYGPLPRTLVESYTQIVAHAAHAGLKLADSHTTLAGTTIYSGTMAVDIVRSCSGLELIALYVAGVVAYPATWRQRLLGLAGGVCLIFIANVARIVVLFLIGTHFRSEFDEVHYVHAQALLLTLTAIAFFVWVQGVRKYEASR